MIWLNFLFTVLILLFSLGTIAEDDRENKKLYHSILTLLIISFTILNFIKWMY